MPTPAVTSSYSKNAGNKIKYKSNFKKSNYRCKVKVKNKGKGKHKRSMHKRVRKYHGVIGKNEEPIQSTMLDIDENPAPAAAVAASAAACDV